MKDGKEFAIRKRVRKNSSSNSLRTLYSIYSCSDKSWVSIIQEEGNERQFRTMHDFICYRQYLCLDSLFECLSRMCSLFWHKYPHTHSISYSCWSDARAHPIYMQIVLVFVPTTQLQLDHVCITNFRSQLLEIWLKNICVTCYATMTNLHRSHKTIN